MLFLPNSSSLEVLKKLRAGATLGEGDYSYCAGWVEGSTQAADVIDVEYGVPESWESVVLQGVHLYVANPRYKFPNASMSSNQDWSLQDLESLEPDSLPTTTFKPIVDMSTYRQKFPVWDEGRQSSLDFYRIAWRAMADNVGKRTMLPVLIPKGAAHVDSVFTMGNVEATGEELALLAAGLSSFLVDFLVRAAPKSTIRANVFERLPKIDYGTLSTPALLRVLRLNCLTSAYSELWQDCYRHSFGNERWTAPEAVARCELGNVESEWSPSVPLRRAVERRRAELELDALTALALDVSADQLCTVYRDQFPVLVKAEKASRYDAKGRLVPGSVVREWRKQGHSISEADRTATNAAGNTYTYELPFVTLDREADMRHAYAHFERILQERS